jgi:putative DNA primase/helicase
MGTNGNMRSPANEWPVWFDGKSINEALFCKEFLHERKIIFANGAFSPPMAE